jgi:hypothetical protein
MMDWEPISEAELRAIILAAEDRMDSRVRRLWDAIKTPPEKWSEATYGAIGGGFWVVAVIGSRAIWFNDIEDGFNCSRYEVVGTLSEYFCDQDELEMTVQRVLAFIETGKELGPLRGPPVPLR